MLALLIVALIAAGAEFGPLLYLERALAVFLAPNPPARESYGRVAVVSVDEESLRALGPRPWPGHIHAELIERLRAAGAATIAYGLPLDTIAPTTGHRQVAAISAFVERSSLPNMQAELHTLDQLLEQSIHSTDKPKPSTDDVTPADAVAFFRQSGLHRRTGQDLHELLQRIRELNDHLDPEKVLAVSLVGANDVLLAQRFLFAAAATDGSPSPASPSPTNSSDTETPHAVSVRSPPASLTRLVTGLGHINGTRAPLGILYTTPLLINHAGELHAGLALQIAERLLGEPAELPSGPQGKRLRIAGHDVRTDASLRTSVLPPRSLGSERPYPVLSFNAVLKERVDTSKLRGRVVIVGAGIRPPAGLAPDTGYSDSAFAVADTVSALVQGSELAPLPYTSVARGILLLAATLYLAVIAPMARDASVWLATALIAIGLGACQAAGAFFAACWLPLTLPLLVLVLGVPSLALLSAGLDLTTRAIARGHSTGDARMIGLALQGRGDLEAAFKQLQSCPADESLLDVLYNLALDFERVGRAEGAGRVYRHIMGTNKAYRDVKQRLGRVDVKRDAAPPTLAFADSQGAILLGKQGCGSPTLGRYEVVSELGRGAMGRVYLGRDPRAERSVAIKTLALSVDYDDKVQGTVKERFFREAQAAGRLRHPNIVTIFDAGEEHELAYIAMELLQGHDLSQHTALDSLLPLARVLEILALCADALQYAHTRKVVHRDVKPANIMYDAETNTIKLTDFGIARVTDTSRTKTGAVLGTPSYMSPEQLAGRTVNGRSDLFSLGVTLFQLSTGRLPFESDSMAALMYQITHEPHPRPQSVRSDLPVCVCAIIDNALEKDPAKRYRDGEQMARDLRRCAVSIDRGGER